MKFKIEIDIENTKDNTSILEIKKDNKLMYSEVLPKGKDVSDIFIVNLRDSVYSCLEEKA